MNDIFELGSERNEKLRSRSLTRDDKHSKSDNSKRPKSAEPTKSNRSDSRSDVRSILSDHRHKSPHRERRSVSIDEKSPRTKGGHSKKSPRSSSSASDVSSSTTSTIIRDSRRGRPRRKSDRSERISEEEKAKKLREYIKVDKDKWMTLRKGTYIRYEKSDGELMAGGFVVRTGVSKAGKEYVLLSGYGKNKNEWAILFETLVRLYMKLSPEMQMVFETVNAAVEDINSNMKELSHRSERGDVKLKRVKDKINELCEFVQR